MKTLNRDDERIVKAMVNKFDKNKARIDTLEERIAKATQELINERDMLASETDKISASIMSLYNMNMDEAHACLADDIPEVVDEPVDETTENIPDDDLKVEDLDAEQEEAEEPVEEDQLPEEVTPEDITDNFDEVEEAPVEEAPAEETVEDDGEFHDVDWDSYNNDGTLNFFFKD